MSIKIKTISLVCGTALVTGCMGSAAEAPATSGSTQASTSGAATAPKYGTPKPLTIKERKQGAELHPKILQEFGGAWQSKQTGYVVRVGKNIALQSGLSNAQNDFEVSLLNSSVNNAFAIPGGYIYITRQLVALCNSEAEMAGVLGHEVGHVAARHSKKRQKRAGLANILGTGGAILGAILGDGGGLGGALGGVLRQYSGTAAQLLTLSYSRGQEEESDDLGIRYLSKAGYDPTALSDMLASLAMQTAVDTRAAGRNARNIPEWASTHPNPAKRVARAARNAGAFATNSKRNRAGHLAAINGMLYGDDPKQGVIEGRTFMHPDLRLRFTVPNGFGMSNGQRAVSINGQSGQALFTTGAYNGNRRAYIDAAFKQIAGKNQTINYGDIQQTTVNGLPAFYATALVANSQRQQVSVTIFAYEFSKSQAFHFATLRQANAGNPFNDMYGSVRRLSANEAAQIKPRKLRVVTVKRGDTVSSLSQRMAYRNLQQERFLALNGMRSNASLQAGGKVKIVTY